MKRRVLFLIPNLKVGGAERVVALLLRHLPRQHLDLHLALLSAHGPFLEDLPADVTVHDLGVKRARQGFRPLLRLVRRLAPAAVLPNLGAVSFLALMAAPWMPHGTRVLVQQHTQLSREIAERNALRGWVYRRLYPRADAIICCSRAMADDLEQNFDVPRQRLRLVRHPLDVENIAAARSAPESPLTGPGPHFLAAGRLAPEKGYDRLLDAFARFAPRRLEARLWLLGDGPERAALERRADGLGLAERVTFAGFQSPPYPFMHHADVFVQTSYREGLPMSILEAVACGTRVAAFDCPGGTGEILGGLEGAALVPDGALDAFADALDHLAGPDRPPPPRLPDEFTLERVQRDFTAVLLED